MPVTLIVPDGYGYVALVALGLIPVLSFVQGSVVTTLRKKANVPYPNAYATAEQAKSNKAAHKFNCAQRAHGNLLENMPTAMGTLLFSGLFYPTYAASFGAFWVASRAVYAYGYIASDEANGAGRRIGGGFWLAQLALLTMSIRAALTLI